MVTLIAKSAFFYAGRWHAVGDRFGANRQDARLLIALGRAVRLELESPIPAAVFTPLIVAEVAAESTPVEVTIVYPESMDPLDIGIISPRTGKPKRAYKRRDQVAE